MSGDGMNGGSPEAASDGHAGVVLTGRLTKALRGLPGAYERLRLFVQPGSRPSDQGSRQRHGDSVRDVVVLAVEDLLSERIKPGVYPARVPSEVELDQVWDPERGKGGEWVRRRRLGVLPTLSQWCRLVDADLWDAGIEHDEYGLEPCGHLCWLAPVHARGDLREGPCSEQPHRHWSRPTVAGECAWLLGHVDWMSHQDWWDVIVEDLAGLHDEVAGIIGELEKTERLTCLSPGCGWHVVEKAGGAWFKCAGCGKSWGRLELHRMAERRKPKTLMELTGPTGLSVVTLRRYEDAGKLTPLPERRGTAKLYDLDQVMDATVIERYKPKRGTRGRFTRREKAS
jgi:hypothetical protein